MYIFRYISKSLSHRDKSNTNCSCLMKGGSGTVDSSQVHTLLTSLQVTQAGSHLWRDGKRIISLTRAAAQQQKPSKQQ